MAGDQYANAQSQQWRIHSPHETVAHLSTQTGGQAYIETPHAFVPGSLGENRYHALLIVGILHARLDHVQGMREACCEGCGDAAQIEGV